MNKNFMYGVGKVTFNDFVVGYIEKNSFDLGGTKPEVVEIDAEQVPGAPVLVIPQSNGTIAPSFNVIQLNFENLQKMLGGTLQYKAEDSLKANPIGWCAPSTTMILTGPWQIDLVSGQSILLPNATLTSDLGGKLTLSETAKIEATLKIAIPEKGGSPYGIYATTEIPKEWTNGKGLPAEGAAAAAAVAADPVQSSDPSAGPKA